VERELLALKSQPEILDVLIFIASTGKWSKLHDTEEYEQLETLGSGVQLVRLGTQQAFLVQKEHPSQGKVAVLVKGDATFPPLRDHTLEFAGMAALKIAGLVLALGAWLVLFRLYWEMILLGFRLVDEAISIRNILEERRK